MTDEQQVSTRLSFETDEDGITIYAIVIAEADGFEYSEEWLEKALVKEGYSGLTVSNKVHAELAGLVNDNHSGKVKLGKKIDAKVEAFLSGDLLTASLKVTAAKGGKRAGITEVMNALNDKEIELHLVNKKRIVGLVRKSRIVAPGEVVEVVVAKGLAPEHGKDTQFECLIEGVTDRQPHEREDGSLDYYDLPHRTWPTVPVYRPLHHADEKTRNKSGKDPCPSLIRVSSDNREPVRHARHCLSHQCPHDGCRHGVPEKDYWHPHSYCHFCRYAWCRSRPD